MLVLSGCKSSENYKSFFDSKYKDQKLKLLIVPLINKNENGKILNQYEEPGLVCKTKDSSSFELINNYLMKLKEISRFNSVDICFSNKYILKSSTEFLEVNKKKTIEIRRLSYSPEELKQYDFILYLNMRVWYHRELYPLPIENKSISEPQFPLGINHESGNIIYDINFVYEETKSKKILFYRYKNELTFETAPIDQKYLSFFLVRETPFLLEQSQDFRQIIISKPN